MEYTKGERTLYCGDDYWFVEIKDKPDRPHTTIGKFHTKEDALLDAAAPDMYEALKQAQRTFEAFRIKETDPRYIMISQALAKAGGK